MENRDKEVGMMGQVPPNNESITESESVEKIEISAGGNVMLGSLNSVDISTMDDPQASETPRCGSRILADNGEQYISVDASRLLVGLVEGGHCNGVPPPGSTNNTALNRYDPRLPIDGLPNFLQNLVITCEQVYQTPRDFWAAAIFIATAVGIGNSVKLIGKYVNNPALWWLFVAPSGTGKSEPLDFALKPFMNLDAINFRRRGQSIVPSNETTTYNQTILNDYTPEAMVKVHSQNHRGICIFRDEFMGSIKDIGRYSKSGEVEFMLSIWNGKSAVVNRKGQDTLRIDNPCVTMAGGIQERLIQVLAKEGRSDNGMIPRFMFVWPERAVKPEFSNEVLPSSMVSEYEAYIEHLLSITGENTISLDHDADSIYATFFNENARITNMENDDYLKEMYAKLDIIVLRLALIVHNMKIACEVLSTDLVSVETMSYAIRVTEYFRNTAKKVIQTVGGTSPKMNKRDLILILKNEFGKTNQSEIARFLGVSSQYINKILTNN